MPNLTELRVGTEAGAASITIEMPHLLPEAPLGDAPGWAGALPASARSERLDHAAELWHGACKRTLDVAVSASILLLTLPIVAIVALVIIIDSPGGVFYRADRVGRHGRKLRMLKFRKMRRDASGGPLTMATDERFTRIGKLLAKTKLDELPQLWHVLRGEMSLIGPRPEDPGFVAERAEEYSDILTVRPGITGLSQIAFAEESAILCKIDPMGHYRERIFPQKTKLDRLYASRASVTFDLRILFWTAAAVLMRRDVAVHRETGAMNLRRRG